MTSAFKAVVTALLAESAGAWGSDGHSLIGEIAQGLLTHRARTRALQLLGKEGNLSAIANWADNATHTKEFGWSRPLHFTDIRDKSCWHGESAGYVNCTFNYQRDCTDEDGKIPDFCVAGAIKNYSKQLREGLKRNDASREVVNALKFVVHFTGDIHQPLHCGLVRDHGGVNTNVFYPVKGQDSHWNLHNVWDFGLIVNREGGQGNRGPMVQEIQSLLSGEWKKNSSNWEAQADPKEWVQETLDAATHFAYRFPNGTAIRHSHGKHDEVHLQSALQPYIQRGGIIDRQLAKGAVRLAVILNEILDGEADQHENMVVV